MDSNYTNTSFALSEFEHGYPSNVHILKSPYLLTILANLCRPDTAQPFVNQIVRTLYQNLVNIIVNNEFKRSLQSMPTRMIDQHKEAVLHAEMIEPNQNAVTVNLARAGTFPSHICYDALNYILNPKMLRQDHFILNRETDDKGQVTGTNISGSKIGGDIEDSIVLFPDPMGATGGTLDKAVEVYKKEVKGNAFKYIALHLIVTPEYIKRVTSNHPELIIYAVRLDRGLSNEEVLKLPFGKKWEEERGLNDQQYIIPGGGGLGEILNNSFC